MKLNLRKFTTALLVALLAFCSTSAGAQSCGLSEPQLLYSFPGYVGSPEDNDPVLYSLAAGDITTESNTILPVPAQELLPIDGFGQFLIRALAWDPKAQILYYSLENLVEITGGQVYAVPLPINGERPTLVYQSNGDVRGIAVDHTNRDRVYIASLEFDQFNDPLTVIAAIPRQDEITLTPSVTAISTNFSAFPESIDHKPSAAPEGDSLVVVARPAGETANALYTIPLGESGLVDNPAPVIADLLEGSGFNYGQGYRYDRMSDTLYSLAGDASMGLPTDNFSLHRLPLSDPLNGEFLSLAGAFAHTSEVKCFAMSLGLLPARSSQDAILYPYCTSFQSNPAQDFVGLFGTDGLGNLINPLFAIEKPVATLAASSGATTAFCCSEQYDLDVDGDGFLDCEDPCPTDPLCPAPPTPEPTPTPTPEPQPGDQDGDGVTDDIDACPADFASAGDLTLEGLPRGCPCTDRFDSDFDGLLNCQESPEDRLLPPGQSCFDEGDFDSDGTANCFDACPRDSTKTAAGACGCGIKEAPSCTSDCLAPFEDVGCGCGITDCDTPRRTVTQHTRLPQATLESVGEADGKGRRKVVLLLPEFDGASKSSALDTLHALSPAAAKKKRNKKKKRKNVKAGYQVEVFRLSGSKRKKVFSKTVRKNSVNLKKLPAGLYSISYRVLLQQNRGKGKKKKSVGKTGFSPALTFYLD